MRIRRLLWGLVALAAFLLAIIAVNQESVAIRFLTWRSPEWSLFWWMLIAFLLGAGLGGMAMLPSRSRALRSARRLRKVLDEAEQGRGQPSA